jgi:predicted secreted acid phosphatase
MVKNNLKSVFNNVYDIAYNLGKEYIDSFPLNTVSNPAIMFDIDDTLLYVNDFNGFHIGLEPIKPMIKLLNYAIKKGINIIIITARDSVSRHSTEEDLNNNGIVYNELYLRKNPKDNYELFKNDIKKKYTSMGYTIIMSVGDNNIDIIGDYSGYGLKLPNKTDSRLFEKKLDGNIYIV